MNKNFIKATSIAFVVFVIDQAIKYWAVYTNVNIEATPISLVLAYNKGVAFSMFAGLEGWLKYLQILLMLLIATYLYKNPNLFNAHYLPIGILFGAAFGNIIDRFIHIGVVDYIFWHYLFEFAIFNFADIMINFAVLLILYQSFFKKA
ncbi:signal peptidase II [Helicobacter monodelphidis]|uniref:signal peptidase II n=1 Tax=Helicobacter sp. 15-1451 TaxID=2004995 RepID=UPI000DCD82AE|nr:signal peptidase II [Helicobacter sp. 15-1451]RAX58973.1 signal peptidase II [Helicobacter sp. 15-1451]